MEAVFDERDGVTPNHEAGGDDTSPKVPIFKLDGAIAADGEDGFAAHEDGGVDELEEAAGVEFTTALVDVDRVGRPAEALAPGVDEEAVAGDDAAVLIVEKKGELTFQPVRESAVVVVDVSDEIVLREARALLRAAAAPRLFWWVTLMRGSAAWRRLRIPSVPSVDPSLTMMNSKLV